MIGTRTTSARLSSLRPRSGSRRIITITATVVDAAHAANDLRRVAIRSPTYGQVRRAQRRETLAGALDAERRGAPRVDLIKERGSHEEVVLGGFQLGQHARRQEARHSPTTRCDGRRVGTEQDAGRPAVGRPQDIASLGSSTTPAPGASASPASSEVNASSASSSSTVAGGSGSSQSSDGMPRRLTSKCHRRGRIPYARLEHRPSRLAGTKRSRLSSTTITGSSPAASISRPVASGCAIPVASARVATPSTCGRTRAIAASR